MSIIKKIKNFLLRHRRNPYLKEHGYYDSFGEHRGHTFSYPHLPYSLYDVLSAKRITRKNILVIEHRSTAYWFAGNGTEVTLAQPSGGQHSLVKRVDSYRDYDGAPIDILIWDSHTLPTDWEEFISAHLSPRGVVIITYSHYFDALDQGFGTLGDHLLSRGLRLLAFKNPGPKRDVMTAEFYYPEDNVLDI